MKKQILYLFLLLLITCSKDSTEDTSSVYVAPPSNTTNTPSTTVTQYTITVSAGEGGIVSTAGGTYNDGTQVSITATPNEGYGFIGWNGSDSSSSTISCLAKNQIRPIIKSIKTTLAHHPLLAFSVCVKCLFVFVSDITKPFQESL